MRYLLLILFFTLQAFGYGANANDLQENSFKKELTSKKSSSEERSNVEFRYQGQYFDEETELCYNRFRFYDCNTGTYISQDPIGLAGNNPNFYAYVPDSNSWTDPFGLDCIKNRRIAKELSEPEVLGRLQKKYPIEDGFEVLSEPRVYINNTLNAKGNKAYAKPDFMVIDKKGNIVDLVDAKNGGADFTDFQKALNENGGTFNGSSRSTQLPRGSNKAIGKNSLRVERTNYSYGDLVN